MLGRAESPRRGSKSNIFFKEAMESLMSTTQEIDRSVASNQPIDSSDDAANTEIEVSP